jgi:hypothetical protein
VNRFTYPGDLSNAVLPEAIAGVAKSGEYRPLGSLLRSRAIVQLAARRLIAAARVVVFGEHAMLVRW